MNKKTTQRETQLDSDVCVEDANTCESGGLKCIVVSVCL